MGRVFPRGLFAIAIMLITLLYSKSAYASLGAVQASFPFRSGKLLADARLPYVYAAVPANNAIEVINTRTLTVDHEIALDSSPGGLALSPDGQLLYVAEPAASRIAAIDTTTLTVSRTISTPSAPYDLAAGSNNRLFVLDATSTYPRIQQLDATTGVLAGPDFPNSFYYYGNFQISKDLKTLYYGQHGSSPTTLFVFDVSSTDVQLVGHKQTGSNGKDLVLSHSGKWLVHPNGAPYVVSLLSTDDLSTLGIFNTGSYPGDMAFSPDDRYAYASRYASPNTVGVYDTSTFANIGTFKVPDEVSQMVTDTSGQHLFASFPNIFSSQPATIVYDTGYSVPEPTVCGVLISLALLGRGRRRMTIGQRSD
jgi:YVTN family beta-propeller protein